MRKAKKLLVVLMSAIFLCCAAAFAAGCVRTETIDGGPAYTAELDSTGSLNEWRAGESLTVQLDEEKLKTDPLFTTDVLDAIKDYLTVTLTEDGSPRVLGTDEYTLSGSINTAGVQTFTVIYVQDNSVTTTVEIMVTAVVPARIDLSAAAYPPTLWSTSDLTSIDSRYFTGDVVYNNGESNPIGSVDGFRVEVVADPNDPGAEAPTSLMPVNAEEGRATTYSRFVRVLIGEDEAAVASNVVELQVTRDTIDDIEAALTVNVLDANTQITNTNYGLTVTAFYNSSRFTMREIKLNDPYLEIVYCNGIVEDPGRQQLNFGDTQVIFKYDEPYTGESFSFTLTGFFVREAPIAAPTMEPAGNFIYDGSAHDKTFTVFNDAIMNYSTNVEKSTLKGDVLTLSLTDAGDYQVTFTLEDGFYFQSPLPSGAEPGYEAGADGSSTIITSVTYRWSVTRASLTPANVSFTVDAYWTYADAANAGRVARDAKVTVNGQSIALDEEGVTVTYYYVGRGDTVYADSTAVPTQAGDYSAYVVIQGLANYADVTSNPVNFTIQKATNSLVFNDGNVWEWTYGAALPGDESDLLAALVGKFDAEFAAENENYREEIVLRYLTAAEQSAGAYPVSSIDWDAGQYILVVQYPGSANVKELEERFSITVKQGVVSFEGALSMSDWTFGATAAVPAGVTVFVGDQTQKTQLDVQTAGAYRFSTSAAGNYASWNEFLAANDSVYEGSAALNAGEYYVRYEVPGTVNYAAANGEAASFTVLRRTVAKPTLENAASYTYNGSAQTMGVVGFDAAIMSAAAAAADPQDRITFNNRDTLTATAAGGYTLTVTMTSGNFAWSGESISPSAMPSAVELNWIIDKAQNVITAADAFAGWTYGDIPTAESTLQAALAFVQDGQKIEYTYYAADDRATPVKIAATTPAGEYVLVLSVADSDNTIGAEIERSFTVAVGSAVIEAQLADTESWYYRDDLSEHALSISGTVAGNANLTFGASECTVVYEYSRGGSWEEVNFTDMASAGDYRVTVSLTDPSNFTASSVRIAFTVQRFVVALPEVGRTHEFDGNVWTPSVPASGDRGAQWTVDFETEDSMAYGVYWLTLTLQDTDNYVWGENYLPGTDGDGIPIIDELVGEGVVRMYYSITKTTYAATVNVRDYVYGEPVVAPTLTIDLAGADLEEVLTAEQTIFYRPAGSSGSWIAFNGQSLRAGEYQWRVFVAGTTNFSYSEFFGFFTVNPKELGEPTWSNLTGTYGTSAAAEAAFAGILGGDDLGLTYQYIGVANDGTRWNSSSVPTKAGSYIVTVAVGNSDYCISGSWSDAVRVSIGKEYFIDKVSLTLTVNDATIVYGDDAPHYGYAHTAGTLYFGDTAEGILADISFLYEDGYTAGDDCGDYTVSFANAFVLANYTVTAQSGTLHVEPYELKVFITNPTDLVYDGAQKTATYVTNVPDGFAGTEPVLALGYEMLSGGSYVACGTPIDAGTYRAVVTMTDTTGNYTFTATYGDAFVVDAATILVEEKPTAGIWYTGADYALKDYLIVTVVNGQPYTVAFTVDGESAEVLTDAGTYTVDYSVTAPNHAEYTGSFVLTIQKNTLVWAAEYGREGWTYGGTATAEQTASAKFRNGTAAAGIIAAAQVGYFTDADCLQAYVGSFDSKTPAGVYYVKVTVAGDGNNFDALTKVYSFTVEHAALTVTAQDASILYNADAPVYTADIRGFVNGESAESIGIGDAYTLTCSYSKGSSVGEYEIVAAGDEIVGNYRITYISGTLQVGAQDLTFVVGEMPDSYRTYNGAPISYLVTAYGKVDGEEVDLDIYYNGALFAEGPTDAGTYKVTFAPAVGENYTTANISFTFTILPREVEIGWTQTDTDFYYNGSVQNGGIAVSYALWEDGAKSGNSQPMSVALTAGGSRFLAAGSYTFTASFAGGSESETYAFLSADGNYCMALTNVGRTQTYVIEKRPITVTVTPQTREYGDGYSVPTEAIVETTEISDGLDAVIAGDTAYRLQVQTSSGSAVSGTPNVGTYYIRLTAIDQNYDVSLVSSEAATGTVTYTIVPRELKISFREDFTVVYGEALNENALRVQIDFARVNGSGVAFLTNDSAIQSAVVAALNFSHGGYTVQSNAGDVFSIAISGMNTVPSAGNYTFDYIDARAQLTVLQRSITVSIDSKTGLTYGTSEVWEAANNLSGRLTAGSVVNNDNPYALGVYDGSGLIESGWGRLSVGNYWIVGTCTDQNYNITFTGDADYAGGTSNAGIFAIVANEIIVSVNPSTDVWYTGGEYELLENGVPSVFAREMLRFEANVGTGETLSYSFVISGQGNSLLNAGVYTVSYTVTADNYSDKTGSFTVNIQKNEVYWNEPDVSDWGWTYGDAGAAQPVTEGNVSSLYVPQFVNDAAVGGTIPAPTFAYFTDASCSVPYEGTFDSRTNAGTYYVRVSVADTNNYTGYEAIYSFTVSQKVVTVNWSMPSLQQSAAVGAQNYLIGGYDPAIMQVAGGDFTEDDILSDAKGYYVECSDALGTYILTFVLTDPDNYDWADHDVGSENARTIRFTVSTTVLNITITIQGWTYGDASVDGPQVVVSPQPAGFVQDSIVYTYAAGDAGLTDADMGSLGFAAVADLSMLPAGSYWVRAYVQGADDGSYGMAFGYAHFTVSPRALAAPTDGIDSFDYDGNVKVYLPNGFSATIELPNGQTVAAMIISDNTGVNADDYTATVRLASDNFVWQGGTADEISFGWTVLPMQIAKPTLGAQGTSSYTSTYQPGENQALALQYVQLFDFDAQLMSFTASTGASYANGLVAASDVGVYSVTVEFKQIAGGNYCWIGGGTEKVTLTWTIDPAVYDLGDYVFGEDVYAFTYNGTLQYPTLGNPPTGLRVTQYTGGATNVADGEQTVTAQIELVGPYATNFCFDNGTTSTEISGKVRIDPVQITDVIWSSQNEFGYTGADQSSLVHAYFVKADGSLWQIDVKVQGGAFVNAGNYTFVTDSVAVEDLNYVLSGTFTSGTYTIRPVDVTVVVETPTAHVYDGKRPEPDTARVNEYGYYGFTVLVGGSPLALSDLPQAIDQNEWLTYAPAVQGTGEWNVGSYVVTIEGDRLTNYAITFIEQSRIAVTPAQIVGIDITVPNADGMIYGRLTEADKAFIDPNSEVDVILGDGTKTKVPYSEIADYVTLWYSGYSEGLFSTSVNAGTVWVFPLMTENDTCNYIFTDSSLFAKEFTVQKQTIGADLFAVTDVVYSGDAQALPRDNVAFIGSESWQREFAEFFADPSAVTFASGSYTDVGVYDAMLALSSSVYRNYCFAYGSSMLTLTWEILPLQESDIVVAAPQVSVTDWGENRAAAALIAIGSSASADGVALQVMAFRYEYEMFDGGEWVSIDTVNGFVWNAGSYRVRGIISDANFPAAASDWQEFAVEKGVYAVENLGWQDKTFLYDGAEHSLTLTVGGVPDADGLLTAEQLRAADGIGLTYTVGNGRSEVGSQEISVIITAVSPNYVFMVGGAPAAEYVLTATVTVEARQTVVVWEGGNFVYDGTDLSGGVAAYFYDVNNQRVMLSVTADRDFIDAGVYTFTVTDAPAGYVLVGDREDFTIMPREVSVVWPQDAFVYNGTDRFSDVAAYFTDVNGENVALQLRSFVFRNVNEGGYTFEVLGAADDAYNMSNYRLTGTTQVLHIAPLAVTVIADDIEAVYGEEVEMTWHATEAAFLEDAAEGLIVVTLTREPGDTIGTYKIDVSVGGTLFNYIVTTKDGTYEILQQAHYLQIRLPDDRVYNGNPIVATLVGIDGAVPSDVYLYYYGDANDGTVWASESAPSKAGIYTVEARTRNASLSIECSPVLLVIERAAAVIDVSGVQTQYVYTGALQTVNKGAVLNHGETRPQYENNTFITVAEGDGLRVRIYAVQTANYEAAEAFVVIKVTQQGVELSVSIDDWTYGEQASDYRLTGNAGGGIVTVIYTGYTNAGVRYESAAAPTEAGEYTITVTVAATDDYLSASASDTFTVLRADADLSLAIEGWTYGEQPNDYVLTPAFLQEYIENAIYTNGSLYFMQPPVEAGSYTLIVEVAQSPNYNAGRVQTTFTVTLAQAELSVSIRGWVYGQAPNAPVVQAAEGSEYTLRYTGTANDGTSWDSVEAPSKAGSYKLTITVTEGNFAGESASCEFIVSRAPVQAPSLGEEGERTASAVYDGETVTVVILGYDGAYMQPKEALARFELDQNGRMLLVADEEGVYTVTFVLNDADNYAWAAEEGEDFAEGVVLTWTVTEKVDSLLWLIILLSIIALLLLILFIVLIILEKRAKRSPADDAGGAAASENGEAGEGGSQDKADASLYALAPMGMLVVPASHIAAVISLSIVVAILLIADIWLFVRWRQSVRAAREAAGAAESESLESAAEEGALDGAEKAESAQKANDPFAADDAENGFDGQ